MRLFFIKRILLLFVLVACSIDLLGQFELTMPSNRMVYQRNKQNRATIYVGGSFGSQIDRIEARLTTLDSKGIAKNPLQQTAWLTVVNLPSSGVFLGQLANQEAGWYRLEVRAIKNSTQLGDIKSVKVGIGEVFAIAGQSNAGGDLPVRDTTLFGADDDRVNAIDLNDYRELDPLKYPIFSQLQRRTKIAPTGGCSWVWGPMGDLIAKNWDVPVLFYNGAVGNTSIFSWRAGANYENTADPTGRSHLNGWPFVYLQKALQYYCSLTGVRAVLWAQGENDTGNFNPVNLDPSFYRDNLVQVIRRSRDLSKKELSWVIAKSSRTGDATSFQVIAGQEQVINLAGFNTFEGPSTDNIQPSFAARDVGGAHFVGEGIRDVGRLWYNSLNNLNFLNNSIPHAAIPPQSLVAGKCADNIEVNLGLTGGYTNYAWFDNNDALLRRSQNIDIVGAKTVYGSMRDSEGKNYVFSPPAILSPGGLKITTDRSPNLCEGQVLKVFTNTFNDNFVWSTGASTASLELSQAGTYDLSVKTKDVFGCEAIANTRLNVLVNPIPFTPTIKSVGSASICQGSSVALLPDTLVAGLDLLWSNGQKTNFIDVSQNGTFSLVQKDKNNCESKPSNQITVQVNPNPLKPEIAAGGPTTFCEGQFVKMALTTGNTFEWFRNDKLESNLNTQFIDASLPGTYKGRVLNQFNCPSPFSDQISVTNWPLPAAPIVTASGPTIFCAGGNVVLEATSNVSAPRWYLNNATNFFSTDNKVSITSAATSTSNTDAEYFATVIDGNGCASTPSTKFRVSIRSNPTLPRINKIGSFTLEAKASILGQEGASFEWTTGGQILSATTKSVKVNKPGNYQVKAKINYPILGSTALECVSATSERYFYETPGAELIMAYNNPSTDGKLFLEAKEDYSGVSVEVFTPLGAKVFSSFIAVFDKAYLLNLGTLPNGIYKLKVNANGLNIIKSLMIAK